jgi:hypothetical protein
MHHSATHKTLQHLGQIGPRDARRGRYLIGCAWSWGFAGQMDDGAEGIFDRLGKHNKNLSAGLIGY